MSETSSGRGDRTPNAVDKEVTRDGLRHCVTRRPGPHWHNVGASSKAVVELSMSYLGKARRSGLALREREGCQMGSFLNREVACQVGKVETGLAKGACQKCNACERTTDSRAVTLEEFQM